MLRMKTKIAVVLAAFAATVAAAAPAAAQATRTWVSGVGDDANPCSRTAPCKTFAGSISKTAAGGEINCLDPGGFGAVTITKSLTINCDGTLGSVLVSGTSGITVNAGDTDKVVVRNLDIEGLGTGTYGIRLVNGGSLTIDKVTIRNFNNAGGSAGILFTPQGASASTLTVTNTSVINNGSSGSGTGILIQAAGTGAVTGLIENTQVVNSQNIGLSVSSVGASAGTRTIVVVKNSDISNGAFGATAIVPPGTRNIQLTLNNTVVSSNVGYGVSINGTGAQGRISNSVITGNATGIQTNNSGAVLSHGGNAIYANTTDGTFTATFPQQ